MDQDIGGERISLSQTSCAYKPCYIGKNLHIGESVSIGSMCHVGRNVTIGEHSNIQGSCYISDRTIIGKHVFVGPNSTILNDKYPPSGDASKWMPVQIHDRAVLGGGSTILLAFKWAKVPFLAEVPCSQNQFPQDKFGQEIQPPFE